tara:strand:+ start:384 stop:1136 length:753 start_codon:yes stop_codon:yes gene_type:complete
MKLLSFQKQYYKSFAKSSYNYGKILSKLLNSKFEISSVIDFGSGTCDLVYGFSKPNKVFVAIDNHNENIDKQFLNKKNYFYKLDLTKKIDFQKKFDCCLCFEVLEHIDNSKCDTVIDNITKHSDLVVFSSAREGQGGLNHINEQKLDYWINKFKNKNYNCYDYIRPHIINENIPYYFKANTLVFINKNNLDLTKKVNKYLIYSDLRKDKFIYKIRKFILKNLNVEIINYLVLVNYMLKNLFFGFIKKSQS